MTLPEEAYNREDQAADPDGLHPKGAIERLNRTGNVGDRIC